MDMRKEIEEVVNLGTFVTKKGGIVTIVQYREIQPEKRIRFDAWWLPDFKREISLGGWENVILSYDSILDKLKRWDPEIKEIKDLGEYTLYYRTENVPVQTAGSLGTKKNTIVSLKPRSGCIMTILAKDVPTGAFLINKADNFFRYYRGEDAVDSKQGRVRRT
jgi:hypothetical protein